MAPITPHADTLIKCLRTGRTHYGYTYVLGRNTCPQPWNDVACADGGLYVCTLRNLFVWMDLYPDITEVAYVSVPEGAERVDFETKIKVSALDVLRVVPLAEAVKCALDVGANVHAHEDVALRWAAEHGYIDIVQILLDGGADVHARDDRAFISATQGQHIEVAELLLKYGADVHARDDTGLDSAVELEHVAMVKLLLGHGASVQAGDGRVLKQAAYTGNVEIAKLLLAQGADVHAGRDHPLVLATRRGHAEMIKLLQEHGARVPSH